ncbi:uncharacterized protein G2W53_025579 [Senna tora]|uniref:Uncharacterized protein n=1 Tax=Senna tora TaxID=362788 RepID=A0A834TMI9_9FABA|nr:uncharacterized protein G2W53_025579 [Senna tora]
MKSTINLAGREASNTEEFAGP